MSTRVTWKFVEETMFPLAVKDAHRIGIDTQGWSIQSDDSPGRIFAKVDGTTGALTIWHRFERPEDADRFFQGVRWALTRPVLERLNES